VQWAIGSGRWRRGRHRQQGLDRIWSSKGGADRRERRQERSSACGRRERRRDQGPPVCAIFLGSVSCMLSFLRSASDVRGGATTDYRGEGGGGCVGLREQPQRNYSVVETN
jgi:hypothetical protein